MPCGNGDRHLRNPESSAKSSEPLILETHLIFVNSPFLRLPSHWHSTFYVYKSDYSRDLKEVLSHSICLFVTGLFHSAQHPGGSSILWHLLKFPFLGSLCGSVVECLPSALVIIPGSWDRVPHQAPCRKPAFPSACVSPSLCVSHE